MRDVSKKTFNHVKDLGSDIDARRNTVLMANYSMKVVKVVRVLTRLLVQKSP